MALTNKGDHKDNYKEIFEKLVKEKFDEIKQLNYETNHNDVIHYFKSNATKEIFNEFNNDIERFKKM